MTKDEKLAHLRQAAVDYLGSLPLKTYDEDACIRAKVAAYLIMDIFAPNCTVEEKLRTARKSLKDWTDDPSEPKGARQAARYFLDIMDEKI